MLRMTLLPVAMIAAAIAGCQSSNDPLPMPLYDDTELDSGMVQRYFTEQIDSGIVRQRTIYSHHFVDQTAHLNELGRRDISVLARHYRQYGGSLHVRQGPTSNELYAVRLESIRAALAASGVSKDQVVIDDGLPGGDGLSAEAASRALENHRGDESAENYETMEVPSGQ